MGDVDDEFGAVEADRFTAELCSCSQSLRGARHLDEALKHPTHTEDEETPHRSHQTESNYLQDASSLNTKCQVPDDATIIQQMHTVVFMEQNPNILYEQ